MRPAKTVLLVSADEKRSAERAFLLKTWGYQVRTATTAKEALDVLGNGTPQINLGADQVDLLIVEQLDPTVSRELLRDATQLFPQLRTLFLYGHDIASYACGVYADLLLPMETRAAELLERVRVLTARKRGPSKSSDEAWLAKRRQA